MDKPKLKNSVIVALVERGLENTTDHSVDCGHAYKVYKFVHEVLKANKEIMDERAGLVKAAGIDDPQKFDERRAELKAKPNLTEAEKKELAGMDEKIDRFSKTFEELLNNETELDVKTIPFEQYHKLANENKSTPATRMVDGKPMTLNFDIFTMFRADLENVLWLAPIDND